MGSSMDASNPPSKLSQAPKPAQANQSQSIQSQNTSQAAQSPNASPSKALSLDNNKAASRKECEYESR